MKGVTRELDHLLSLLEVTGRRLFEAHLHPARGTGEGIPPVQARALRFLDRNPGSHVGDIARALGISRPAASQVIDRLEGKGFVIRAPGQSRDRRLTRVALSRKGRGAITTLDRMRGEILRRCLTNIAPRDRKSLMLGMARLVRAMIRAGGIDEEDVCLRCGRDHHAGCPLAKAAARRRARGGSPT